MGLAAEAAEVVTVAAQEAAAVDTAEATTEVGVAAATENVAVTEDQAATAVFLASDDASFITASTFLVDGGISGAYVTPV